MKKKYDVRDEKNRHIRPLFFKYIDGYKGYRDGYYIYVEEAQEFVKQGMVESYRDAKEIKDGRENVIIERGRMSYLRHETSMDYLELCINKFRCYQRRTQPKKFADILVPADQLCGQVWYPQVRRILETVREAIANMTAVWMKNDWSMRDKRRIANEIRQECTDYVCNVKMGEKTMRYLVECIESKDCSDISRFLFQILFGTPNKEFYQLIAKSRTPIYCLQEDEHGDILIYDFRYLKVPA